MAETNLPDLSLIWSSAGDILQPSDAKIQQGWLSEIPPRQWFNWLDNRQDQAIAHIAQHGIVVWSDVLEYQAGKSYVQGSDGELYKALTTNINQNPTTDNGSNWTKVLFSGHGQCRFEFVSSTQCKLSPYGGNSLIINGQTRLVPSTGITISNSGLVANTLYYCYAFVSSGSIVLELSTTGHSQNASNGVETKNGDSTRTLVGMVYTGSGSPGVFVNSANSRCVLSWFNRKNISSSFYSTSGSPTFTNTTRAIIWPETSISFITWADEACVAQIAADAGRVSGAGGMSGALHTDGSPNGNVSAWSAFDVNGVGSISSVMFNQNLSEGFHINALYCGVSSGAGRLVTIVNTCTIRG